MIDVRTIHPWNLTYEKAADLQTRLREEVRLTPLPLKRIRYLAGADIAVSRTLGSLIAAVVVMRFPELSIAETQTARSKLAFPYIPGLLSFREIPALIRCLKKIRTSPDVILCDGQGIAHPRRLGLASHLGLLLQRPTIGCAKTRLVGEYDPVGPEKGAYTPLMHRGRCVGAVVRTRAGVKPVFVSPGHLIDIRSARRVVLACLKGFRLPEPVRRAHILAGEEKRSLEVRSKRTV